MSGDFELDLFIQTVQPYGMPVIFLKHLQEAHDNGRYKFTLAPKKQRFNAVNMNKNRIELLTDTVAFLQAPVTISAEVATGTLGSSGEHVGIVYHEATHAFMDLALDNKIESTKSLMQSASDYYKVRSLASGNAPEDPDDVALEAAGNYVGRRTEAYWHILARIYDAQQDWIVSPSPQQMSAQRSVRSTIGALSRAYEIITSERIFGYQNGRRRGNKFIKDDFDDATAPIPEGLRNYCDTQLLENKIEDSFRKTFGPLIQARFPGFY